MCRHSYMTVCVCVCVCVYTAYMCVFQSRTKRPGSSVALRAFTVVSVKSLTGHTTLRIEQNKQNKLEWKKIRKVRRRGGKQRESFSFILVWTLEPLCLTEKTKRSLSEIMIQVERKKETGIKEILLWCHFWQMLFVSLPPQASSFLSEAQFSAELPETLDPLFKFHETIAKVRPPK